MTSYAETTPSSADTGGNRLATRLSFFAAGFVMACWAPMVPFAKANVRADEGQLGLLLLCLGLGSILFLFLSGVYAIGFGQVALGRRPIARCRRWPRRSGEARRLESG